MGAVAEDMYMAIDGMIDGMLDGLYPTEMEMTSSGAPRSLRSVVLVPVASMKTPQSSLYGHVYRHVYGHVHTCV